jgi:hypothetical protein
MTNEEWKTVVGYEGFFEVSTLGRVRAVDRCFVNSIGAERRYPARMLIPQMHRSGYLAVCLSKAGKQRTWHIHRLVLVAWCGPPPPGHEACHNDGTKTNNTLPNLRWDTRKRNHADKRLHGTSQHGERNGFAKLRTEQVLAIRADDRSQYAIAAAFGISQANVNDIKLRKLWTHI